MEIRPFSTIFRRFSRNENNKKKLQLELGETPIENIKFNPKSRDDIPAVLIGLQHIYSDPRTRQKLFSLLEEKFSPKVNLKVGRPGMDIWRVVMLGALKAGSGL